MTRRWKLLGLLIIPFIISRPAACAETAQKTDQLSEPVLEASGVVPGPTSRNRVTDLIHRGEHQMAEGLFRDALTALEVALRLAREADDTELLAAVTGVLGELLFRMRRIEKAEKLVAECLDRAQSLHRDDLTALALNLRGNILAFRNELDAARDAYETALRLARQASDRALQASIRINLAALNNTPRIAAGDRLEAAYKDIGTLPVDDATKPRLLLSLGYRALERDFPELSYRALHEAFGLASRLKHDRLFSEALGYLARLYQRDGRIAEALGLTQRAIMAAQTVSAEDLLYRWEVQQGELLQSRNVRQEALDAYRRSVVHIQAIRNDIPLGERYGRSKFRDELVSIYLRLADLLLRQAGRETEETVVQDLLREAQATLESIKAGELQDYFKDACAVTQRPLAEVERMNSGTAVLYPIIFEDRLELLLGLGAKKHRFVVPVEKAVLERTARKTIQMLHTAVTGSKHRFRKQQVGLLYRWLVEPLEELLRIHAVHTLAYVPDGVLRGIPLSVLWDGERYLVERFAVATLPGLTLFDPKPLPPTDISALLAGLSRPGGVVTELLGSDWRVLDAPSPDRRGRPGDQAFVFRALPPSLEYGVEDARTRALSEVEKNQLAGLLLLPGVEKEIRSLSEILPAHALLDEAFRLARFEDEVRRKHRIVHIASHGLFTGNPETSYILTYDHVLTMSRLEALFKSEAFSDQPVELLTLSACQTAEGDARSPLGLSGVAIKSGARSALGSLWPVSDEVAQRLFPDFYRQLQESDLSKAQALRQAQVRLLQSKRFRHPSLWAPFLLIGNWM
jgi:CHAT domain-containing protein/predicted negative regulator of RcsB-dependent stress response